MTTLNFIPNFIPKNARLCNNTYIINVTPELAKQSNCSCFRVNSGNILKR
jgi:hypothetical protein